MTDTDADALDAGLRLETTAEQRENLRLNLTSHLHGGIRVELPIAVDNLARGVLRLLQDFDAILAALRSERVRGEESMRERARPLDEWSEDDGDVLWWFFPMTEAPYVGSPLHCGRSYEVEVNIFDQTVKGTVTLGGWPGYHTHWTPLPALPTPDQETTHG